MPLAGKISASNLIYYLSSHPATLGFQVYSPPDNIVLTPTNKRTDQCLSDLQTGIGAVTPATLDT